MQLYDQICSNASVCSYADHVLLFQLSQLHHTLHETLQCQQSLKNSPSLAKAHKLTKAHNSLPETSQLEAWLYSVSVARLSRHELTTAGRRGSVTVNTTARGADQTENLRQFCRRWKLSSSCVSDCCSIRRRLELQADRSRPSLWSLVQQLWFHLMHGN